MKLFFVSSLEERHFKVLSILIIQFKSYLLVILFKFSSNFVLKHSVCILGLQTADVSIIIFFFFFSLFL